MDDARLPICIFADATRMERPTIRRITEKLGWHSGMALCCVFTTFDWERSLLAIVVGTRRTEGECHDHDRQSSGEDAFTTYGVGSCRVSGSTFARSRAIQLAAHPSGYQMQTAMTCDECLKSDDPDDPYG